MLVDDKVEESEEEEMEEEEEDEEEEEEDEKEETSGEEEEGTSSNFPCMHPLIISPQSWGNTIRSLFCGRHASTCAPILPPSRC